MSKHDELVKLWRSVGPAAWAEGPHGWTTETGASIILEPWQRAVLAAWWAHRDTVSTLAISNIKKTGKTLLNALLLAWRWLALPGLHFAAGNDLDQSAGRQFAMIADMVKRNTYLKAHCVITKTAIEFLPTRSLIMALAVDAAGNAGANFETSSHTEAWGIFQEGGIRSWEELTPPPGERYGFGALRIADSYAGYEGESETWHKLVDSALAGELISDEWPIYRAGGVLLFHAEGEDAQRRCFRGTPAQAAAYYADQKAQLRPMAYTRLHENKRTSGAETFITSQEWEAIETELAPIAPTKAVPLFLGLDLAVKRDWAAAVGVSPMGEKRARIALHKIWKPDGRAPISLTEVFDWLLWIHQHYWLAGIFFDPSQALFMAEQGRAKGLRFVEVPQSLPELGPRGLMLFEAIRDGRLTTYADDELKAAAVAAIAREVPSGIHITKGANKARKIDPIAALSFCLPAALEEIVEAFGLMVEAQVYSIGETDY